MPKPKDNTRERGDGMTVSELIEKLKECPQDAEFLVCGGDFGFLWHSPRVVSVDNSDWNPEPKEFGCDERVVVEPEGWRQWHADLDADGGANG